MSQKRWIVELSFKDSWACNSAPSDSDWKPDDTMAPDWKDKRLALERAYQIGATYHCFTRVRRTDEKTAPICHWPYNRDDLC